MLWELRCTEREPRLHSDYMHNCCATVGTGRLTASATTQLRAHTRQRRSDRHPPTLILLRNSCVTVGTLLPRNTV